jgi:protein TonB
LIFAAASLGLHACLLSMLLVGPSVPELPETDALAYVTLPLAAGVPTDSTAAGDRATPVPLQPVSELSRFTIDPPAPAPIEFDAVVADAFAEAREPESEADVNALQRMEGVYKGQVRARLARVLQMALSDQQAPSGPCEARVIQNERGDVMDIELGECSYDAVRKQALVSAIRRASPLPAPPAGLALGASLTLDLTGL